MKELRTATSKTFRNDDGSFTTSVFSGPVHFRDEGSWKEIDTDLVEADAPGFAYRNAAASFAALFKDDSQDGFMRFVAGDRAFDLSIAASSAGRSSRSRSGIAYRGIFPGVDVSYDILPDGVKETLVLEGPGAPAHYRFYLDTPDAGSIEVRELENGAWAFQDMREEEPLFVLDAPYALDASDPDFEMPPAAAPEPTPSPSPSSSPTESTPPTPDASPEPGASPAPDPVVTETPKAEATPDEVPASKPDQESKPEPQPAEPPSPTEPPSAPDKNGPSGNGNPRPKEPSDPEPTHASMNVTRVGDRFAVDLALDAAWLHDPERSFPVLLDPSITIQPDLEDANFNADCPTCTPSLRALNYIGVTESEAWRTAVQFDLGAIPAGAAQVSSAQLKLHYGACMPVKFTDCTDRSHQLDVHRMTSAWTTSSTTQSLGFDSTPLTSYTLATGAQHTWMNWDLTPTVKSWLSGSQTNFGLLVKRSAEATMSASGPLVPGRRYTQEPSLRPALEVTWTADAVTLAEPDTLHAHGADLSWTPYAGASAFTSYEIHRSATDRFTPTESTLLTEIGIQDDTSYTDVTAAPSKTFTYKVVTNGNASNERTVTLPASGTAVKLLQPVPAPAESTYVTHDTGYRVCDNNGAKDRLYVGAESTYLRRPLVKFDLQNVPTSASVTSATLSLWHPGTLTFSPTVNVHRLTSSWDEGDGMGTCTRNGATWYDSDGMAPWTAEGVDFDSTVAASTVNSSGEEPGWDDFNVTSLAGEWLAGTAPNHGVLVKLSNETLGAGKAFSYWADDYTIAPTLRPKLKVTYTEPVLVRGPSVAIASPAPGSMVKGSSVTLSAAASDDRRVDKVEFLVDGSLVGTDTSVPYAIQWNSTSVANGSRSITARATDDAGNVKTSAPVSITVGNSNAPTVSVTSPASGSSVANTVSISANAYDDVAVSRVEFFVDGLRIGDPDTASPYGVSWNTLDPARRFYDGTHQVTAKAWDGHGNVTPSTAISVNVANTAGTKFRATIVPTGVPQAMTYDPALTPQDSHPIDVTVTNTSATTWATTDVVLRYQWIAPDGTAISHGVDHTFATDVPAGATRTVRVPVYPPALGAGTHRSQHKLRFDLYSLGSAAWFADKGNQPSDQAVSVNKEVESTGLGLERYYPYEGEALGAGMTHLTNVASGNSLIRWTPFSSPGRGLSTSVDLTYNSLEDGSDSPAGNNFSLGISTLTRMGLPLDIHPNVADANGNRLAKFIEFTDGDGTRHRFTQNSAGGWDEPAGVHLYLRQYPGTDAQRKWALTRPDRVTYFYDDQGFPTFIEDKNGNRIQFTLENVPPAEDPAGVKRRVTTITDAAGLGASPAPNRSFSLSYYSSNEASSPLVRGRIRSITDHDGSALRFDYYDDGNLLRLTQVGGTKADGSALADRSFVFTYTTPSGSGPAISAAADRVTPAPKTVQSTRIFSVRDPRGAETTFSYHGGSSGGSLWKLQSRTTRSGQTTSFAYDTDVRRTTVTAPMSRVTKYDYDSENKVTGITNPKNETTTVQWTADRHVSKVIEPTLESTSFDYNDNGYMTEASDQLGNVMKLEYEDLPVDANDVPARWKTGREIPHISQLVKKTAPKGTATTTPADDYQYRFEYDVKGNLTKVIEPEGTPGYSTTYTYNPDGTMLRVDDALDHQTKYLDYDANGFPTVIRDAKNQDTKFGFDADGLLLWMQDPEHSASSGGDPRRYRSYFDYDSFHRLGRQSAPQLTRAGDRRPLIWSGADFDQNDNVISEFAPEEGYQYVRGPETKSVYDPMDRVSHTTNPGDEKTEVAYDVAGRVTKVTTPKGTLTPAEELDYATVYHYDDLDRVKRQIRYDTSVSPPKAHTTHYCYDLAGDLTSITAPKANVDVVDCIDPPDYTTKYGYDEAHRRETAEDPLGHLRQWSYDPNGNVETVTDPLVQTTTMSYDERDLLTKTVEPFNDTRSLTTRYEFDAVGNLAKQISPRAHDSGIAGLATRYAYDALNRLTRVDLPNKGGETPTFIYRQYDANGNVARTTVPVDTPPVPSSPSERPSGSSAPPWASIPDKMVTSVTYYDTGLPRTINDHVNALARYDYDSRGQQTKRIVAGQIERWSYYDDGMLKEHHDRKGAAVTNKYDANNNLREARDSSGVNNSEEYSILVQVSYDTLDRVSKVRQRKGGKASDPFDFTSYDYDLNGNVVERKENGTESSDGSQVLVVPKRHTFTYDKGDRLDTQLDYLTDGCQKVKNDFNALGFESLRKVSKASQQCGSDSINFNVRQSTVWSYFKNDKLKKLQTVNGNVETAAPHAPISPAIVIEEHEVGYVDDGIYVNGHRTADTFFRKGPGSDCSTPSDPCDAKYFYDGVDRLVKEDRGYDPDPLGKKMHPVTVYDLTPAGSVDKETTGKDHASEEWTDYTYDGMQLDHAEVKPRDKATTGTSNYIYTAEGQINCVVTNVATTSCPNPGHTNLVKDYKWDGLNRLRRTESYLSGVQKTSTVYRHDALDRITKEIETPQIDTNPGKKKFTNFTYMGITGQVTQETLTGSTDLRSSDLKTYAYDAYGKRVSMTDDPTSGANKTYTYGHDVHGSVSTLLDDSGTVKATYGYDAYGEKDSRTTVGDAGGADQLNPYRYGAWRFDTGSGTLDMGARRFSPDTANFLQADAYQGALSNLGLSMDPMTGNRYSLAAGNPVGFVEVDGHKLASIGPGNADVPNGPETGDRKLPGPGTPPSQVDGAGWKNLIDRTEPFGVNGRLQPQCYNYPGTVSRARKLAGQCFEQALGPAALNDAFQGMTGTGYNPGWEPPSKFEQMVVQELMMSLIPVGGAARLVGRGVNALRGASAVSRTARASTATQAVGSLADETLVVRGGTNTPDRLMAGAEWIDDAGQIHNLSVNSGTGLSLLALVRGIPHKQVGVTTVDQIRAIGGQVTRDPSPSNPYHCLVSCVTPEALSNLLTPTIRNPGL